MRRTSVAALSAVSSLFAFVLDFYAAVGLQLAMFGGLLADTGSLYVSFPSRGWRTHCAVWTMGTGFSAPSSPLTPAVAV